MKTVSIIIPCFNEEESIPQLKDRLAALDEKTKDLYLFNYIFVDDGSTDKTCEKIEENFTKDRFQLIKHEVNQNLGASMKTGFKNTPKVDYITFLDSDCTFDPLILIDLVKALDEGADLATVSHYHPNGGGLEGVPAWRIMLSKGASILYRTILWSNIYTFTAMVRAVKYEKMKELHSQKNDFSYVAEIFLEAIRLKFKIVEVPTVLKNRAFGSSKMKVLSTIFSHLKIMKKLIMKKISLF